MSEMSRATVTTGETFRTFEDLEAYKTARTFRVAMYAVSRRLPDFEKYELASQIRRAAVSLTNNIAEGHGRWHFLDHIKFLLQARGSLEELLDDVNICEDEKYLPPSEIGELKQRGWHVRKLINGYLRYLRDRKQGNSLALHEDSIPYGDTDPELEDWLASLPVSPF
jgi:four helix bundle protein